MAIEIQTSRQKFDSTAGDYLWYAPNCLRIQTKLEGVQPLRLRRFQVKFNQFETEIEESGMPVRIITLKPRQCGFSTGLAGKNSWRMQTMKNMRAILLADKSGRTDEVFRIYDTFYNLNPLKPMIALQNDRELLFDNPNKKLRELYPGLASSLKAETALDPNAGRAGTKRIGHLTECAFYRYLPQIDDGLQQSIPLAPYTWIYKESTAFGMSGDGEAFYLQWEAAERGDYLYKPFFVAWFEVEDYQLKVPLGFRRNKEEIELCQQCPGVSDANLMWRRLKMSEYSVDPKSLEKPINRIKQEYPSFPEEAFRYSGRPVFDVNKLKAQAKYLRENQPVEPNVAIKQKYLSIYRNELKVWAVPRPDRKYSIGADVAEGCEGGDASSLVILDDQYRQVARWHGLIDPDHFGKLLVELAKIYNKALITPEMNNMGFAVISAIKNEHYSRVFMRQVYDEIDPNKVTQKMGWRTTAANKLPMLAKLSALHRDNQCSLSDVDLVREMLRVVRESNGDVILNGKDRVVAACLACMGMDQLYEEVTIYNPHKKEKFLLETSDKSREKIRRRSL